MQIRQTIRWLASVRAWPSLVREKQQGQPQNKGYPCTHGDETDQCLRTPRKAKLAAPSSAAAPAAAR